jgi:hypothetical protein
MMEAARFSETTVTSTRLHDATTYKAAIFILGCHENMKSHNGKEGGFPVCIIGDVG